METPEEALGSSHSSDSSSNGEFVLAVVKGKRTKRQRTQQLPPPVLSMALVADASSASEADQAASAGTITDDEEDMANCLILLAQGRALFDAGPMPEAHKDDAGGGGGTTTEKFTSRRFAEAATTTNGKAGFYVYECKTCNKCFPSFQALGGHRTSHKKPKLAAVPAAAREDHKLAAVDDNELQISMNSFAKPIASSSQANVKPKVHECSICGSEFSSGQALGGHMRRHRLLASGADAAQEAKKEKSFLSLDLNLPAPADEELQKPTSPRTSLSVAGKRLLIFPAPASASALVVDCHY